MEKIYVQITKASLPTFWYANAIGDVFEVKASSKVEHRFTDWELNTLNGYYIQKQDCKMVKVNKLPQEELDELAGYVVPAPPELEENWQDNLVEPSLLELHIMDLSAIELELSL